jgi:hypothetical protein
MTNLTASVRKVWSHFALFVQLELLAQKEIFGSRAERDRTHKVRKRPTSANTATAVPATCETPPITPIENHMKLQDATRTKPTKRRFHTT